MDIAELKEYLEKHLRECCKYKGNSVPTLYSRGYETALWHILSKIDKDCYLKLLRELEKVRGYKKLQRTG